MVKVKLTPKRNQTRLNFILWNASLGRLVNHNYDDSLDFGRGEAYINMLIDDNQRLESENDLLRLKLDKLTAVIDSISEENDGVEEVVVPSRDLPSCLMEIVDLKPEGDE